MAFPPKLFPTEAERREIDGILHLRRQIDVIEDRDRLAPPPEAADASWLGGIRFALVRTWQDRPLFVTLGIAAWIVVLVSF
jgi:hypothetical protein